jgi:hypothetical protein
VHWYLPRTCKRGGVACCATCLARSGVGVAVLFHDYIVFMERCRRGRVRVRVRVRVVTSAVSADPTVLVAKYEIVAHIAAHPVYSLAYLPNQLRMFTRNAPLSHPFASARTAPGPPWNRYHAAAPADYALQ